MSEMKHTPGPWKIGGRDGAHVPIDGGNHLALAMVVWQMDDDRDVGANSPHCEANARLIAAAPDLLNALRELMIRGVLNPTGSEAVESAKDRARAAIAKAEGRP